MGGRVLQSWLNETDQSPCFQPVQAFRDVAGNLLRRAFITFHESCCNFSNARFSLAKRQDGGGSLFEFENSLRVKEQRTARDRVSMQPGVTGELRFTAFNR
jgi:hypothetical protein